MAISSAMKMDSADSGPSKPEPKSYEPGKYEQGFNYDRYRKLLAEADDEPKRLAFINILIDEKARDQLARQSLRSTLAGMGLTTKSRTD
jgi:hypothetical protein